MITVEDAIEIVKRYLGIDENSSLFIMMDKTKEFEFGWIFFYQTTNYIVIDGVKIGLGGNAPLIVDKRDGSLHVTGTAYPHEKYVEDYVRNAKDL